ncbi:GNAT family N-acetyltransferase [Halobacillus sp. A5]|uniref:GNAT family N-acetyltransferase n=1 Tax=Halobacillus sp. A5 TaxID=2880263 RepID=UPI0020A688AC|nr:GNAT family N-acetyltransferase [Halobacillus sp. A5]MCP3029483.1 GNAT family N-acetyltransferase [Halobacillus sp. A5]
MRSDRTWINEIQESDFKYVKELYVDPTVRKYLGGPPKEEMVPSIFDDMINSDRNSLYWVVREIESSGFIGLVSLGPHHDGEDVEISYQLLPPWWGKGYGTEVVKEVIDYAFNELNLVKVIAETQTANIYSCRLLEKAGMELDKIITRFGEKQSIYSLKKQNT